MLKRVQFEDWQAIITVVAFVLIFSAFLYFCWRAFRMSKGHRKHMSELPLKSEDPPESGNHPESGDHPESRHE